MTTITTQDVVHAVKTELKDYILNKAPKDLFAAAKKNEPGDWHFGDGKDHEWFIVDDHNHVVWNWKTSTFPIWLLCKSKGEDFLNSNWLGGEVYRALQSVLRSKDVTDMKKALLNSEPQRAQRIKDMITQTDAEIKRLHAKKADLENQLNELEN